MDGSDHVIEVSILTRKQIENSFLLVYIFKRICFDEKCDNFTVSDITIDFLKQCFKKSKKRIFQ